MTEIQRRAPALSIVVIFHDMERESQRTLFALSDEYQNGVTADQYEVIVIENGMKQLDPTWVENHGPNFRYHAHETTSQSPAAAINAGVVLAKGNYVALVTDGARLPSPGLVKMTLAAISAFSHCFVSALAWHLGPDVQRKSRLAGYNQEKEDAMLDAIRWKEDGYRLFEVATIAPSSRCNFLNGLPTECSWLALPKAKFEFLGGYDEGFQSPGGGLVSHDFLQRLSEQPNLQPVQLIGEGTFHQIHGGAATGQPDLKPIMKRFKAEYKKLRDREFETMDLPAPCYLGHLRPSAQRFVHKFTS